MLTQPPSPPLPDPTDELPAGEAFTPAVIELEPPSLEAPAMAGAPPVEPAPAAAAAVTRDRVTELYRAGVAAQVRLQGAGA